MAKTATVTDTFTTADTTTWGGYGSNPSVVSGRLSITPTAAYPGIYSIATYDLTSSSVYVNLVQAPNLGNGSSSATLNVQVSSGNAEQILVEGSSLIFRETVSSANNDVSITYNASTHAWLRIREASGTVYWDTSPDGTTWTNQRSKTSGLTLTTVSLGLLSGFYGTEPSPGTTLFDNLNTVPVVPVAAATGWMVGALSMGTQTTVGSPGYTPTYFETASWLWNPIPANPVLDPNSATMVSELASTANGAQRGAALYDYGATLVGPTGITSSTTRYNVSLSQYPAWGSYPFGSDTVPIPAGTAIPPGTDGHVTIADPTTNKVYSIWQATHSGSTWGGTWAGLATLHGDGREASGTSSTASMLSRYAAVIRASEIAAGYIPHALFFSTDISDTSAFRYPAQKTDGDNAGGVSIPIPEGTRVQLDPSINVASIPGITAGELAVAKALQTFGAYNGDKGGSRMAFIFEFVNDGTNPGQVYVNAGLSYDYFNMTHIPWSSLRVLKNWDGS